MTPKDVQMLEKIEEKLSLKDVIKDRSLAFTDISAAKADVSGLTCLQLLKKDLKVQTFHWFQLL